MSSLQKTIMKSKLPPKIPRSAGKLAPFGPGRRKDYTPVQWHQYFERYLDVETDGGTFRVYMTSEPESPEWPRILTLHGGGYSALTWSLFAKEVTNMICCQVISLDLRGHGESKAKDPEDLSGITLANDVKEVLQKMYSEGIPQIILVGHSMGGAIAVRVAHLPELQDCVRGLAVIDVVEGTALESLASMQSFLRSRPTHFRSIEHAIEWCYRSGQVRNVDSARVSMPSQIINCETEQLATNELDDYRPEPAPAHGFPTRSPLPSLGDSIDEEDEDPSADKSPDKSHPPEFKAPAELNDAARNEHRYTWRIDLSKTEPHWAGWFEGLSHAFLTVPAPRLLLLASIDGLDRELTVGQMQGKFQMQVLTRCGHAVHEDCPGEVARVIAAFALRQRLTAPAPNQDAATLTSMPGC